MTDLTIKTYDINYEFLLKNFTDMSLWDKKWTILEYREWIVTMEIMTIYTYDKSITLKYTLKHKQGGYSDYETINVKINNLNMKVLHQQVVGAITRCIMFVEKLYIKATDLYVKMDLFEKKEVERLTEIAIERLNDVGISNKGLRGNYIDNFVSDNSKVEDIKSRYIQYSKFLQLPDLYEIVYKTLKDDTKLNLFNMECLDNVGELSKVKDDFYELIEYFESEDYIEDMVNNLESI